MTYAETPFEVFPPDIKACCADLYQSDWARLLLGDSFHPGGLPLTERLGVLLGLGPSSRLLDVAAGRGTSAIHLARVFGCSVVGVDYGATNVAAATEAAKTAGVAERVRFVAGDAERLEVGDEPFDAVICECAFCTFPDKVAAAAEMRRVLVPGGNIGLSDLTRSGPLPRNLDGLLAWVACIAGARPAAEYSDYLTGAGLSIKVVEPHDDALADLIGKMRTRLLGAELLVKLKTLELPGVDFESAQAMARSALDAVKAGALGYAIIVATR